MDQKKLEQVRKDTKKVQEMLMVNKDNYSHTEYLVMYEECGELHRAFHQKLQRPMTSLEAAQIMRAHYKTLEKYKGVDLFIAAREVPQWVKLQG